MRSPGRRLLYLTAMLSALALAGCGQKSKPEPGSIDLVPETKLGTRIGSIAAVAKPEPVTVEGYGLVGGLPGTGSGNCPPAVRDYLRRYIMAQAPIGGVDVDQLLNSKDTAVVRLQGMVPAAASDGERFDVHVSLLSGSEASSLYGGWLYKAELMPGGVAGGARTLATVEGPVFINTIGVTRPDMRDGDVLGGGRAVGNYRGILTLRKADFLLASRIRNRLNERYGSGTAEALAPTTVGLRIPDEYKRRKLRFLEMVGATYVEQTPELNEARINMYVQRLAASNDKESSEIALEAIGRECLGKLGALLQSSDEEIRLRAARCMLNLRDDRGFVVLREMVLSPKSPRRLEAMDAVAIWAKRNDATAVIRRLLRDSDPAVILAAYEHLRDLEDLAVRQEPIGHNFYLEQVAQTDRKAIFVSRSGEPRIVLFGVPLTCRHDLFVESPDGTVVVNSKPGQEYVSIIRRHPTRPGIIGPVETGFGVDEIVRTLGGEFSQARDGTISGLGVCYADVATLVQQLAAKGAVEAEFWAGPLPKLGLIIKK